MGLFSIISDSIANFCLGVLGSLRLQVHRVSLSLDLPEPLRIAVISDIHYRDISIVKRHTEKIVELVNSQRPEAVFLLGDYVTGSRKRIHKVMQILSHLRASYGVYAILGSHDHWSDAELTIKELKRNRFEVLVNQNRLLRKGKTRICLVGIDDMWAGKPDLEKALKGVPEGIPIILLSHNPDIVYDRCSQRASLTLSGHTHGGQIKWLGKYFIPHTRYGRKHPEGLMREGKTWVFITRGAHLAHNPPRFFCPPEIVIIEFNNIYRRMKFGTRNVEFGIQI